VSRAERRCILASDAAAYVTGQTFVIDGDTSLV
jgi:NAD(P)-dependent dehydrogenase (short-subunit alcohol dehydrogenase family)